MNRGIRNMTRSFKDVLYLFSCGSLDIEPDIIEDINVIEIYHIALQQGVWNLVFIALQQLYDRGKLDIDDSLFNRWKNEVMFQTMHNIRRAFAVNDLLQALESAGIRTCVLKGDVLANLYANPNSRVSSDTDILIDPNLEKKALRVLRKKACDIKGRHRTSHHARCIHPIAGLIELHIKLYDEIFEDIWFDNLSFKEEDFMELQVDSGNYVTTLAVTDGLIFIVLHCIKHFLSKGVGIRQVMDILLYMAYYKDKINWDRFNRIMQHLKYDEFINNLVGIGIEYLQFDRDIFIAYDYDKALVDKLLSDIEDGGVFGQEDDDRMDFYRVYSEERYRRFGGKQDFIAYMKKWWGKNLFGKIFISRGILAIKFPYVKKSPLLLPIGWVHRIIRLLVRVIKGQTSIRSYITYKQPRVTDEKYRDRMDLIRDMRMI